MKLLLQLIDASLKGLLVAGVLVLPVNSPAQAQDFGELSGAKTVKRQRVELDYNSPKFNTSGSVVGPQKSATHSNRGQQVQATVHSFHQMKFRNPGDGWTAWPKSGINFDAYNHPKAAARPIVQAPKEQPKAPATHCFDRQNDLWAYQDAVTNSQQSTTGSGHAAETDAYGSVIKK